MRACVQRVHQASVAVEGETVGQIETGMVVLLGVAQKDTHKDLHQLADKLVALRIFEDEAGKMNRSLLDVHGQMLVISQFTLFGDCRKGRRPSFVTAADPILAEKLYNDFVIAVAAKGVPVSTGVFRAHMDLSLVNDGPVTLLLDSQKLF